MNDSTDLEMTTYFLSEEDDSSGDYDIGPTGSMCSKGLVRQFRGEYEPPLYWIIFILGAIGNLLVVSIYTFVRNRLKTMTDVYLLNLAVADLLFLCTLPFRAAEAFNGFEFGTGACKVVSAVYKINFFSSMLLLTCISVDRYIAIVQVTKAQNLKRKRLFYSKLVCVLVWIVSAVLALPEFIFAQVKTDEMQLPICTMVYLNNLYNRTKIMVLSLQICMGFCLPLLVMIFCYAVIIRTLLQAKSFEKHKALKVIFAVVAVFVLTQLPYNSLLIMEAKQAANISITDCNIAHRFDVAGQIAQSLAFTHACLNPFLYVFIGVRFRQDLLKIVKMCVGRLEKGAFNSIQSTPKRPSIMSETETTPALSL